MGRAPCCNKSEVKKGAWTPEEDKILVDYITNNGHATWRSFPKLAGLRRCGKSCRLRWTNYLRPDIKRGAFGFEEEQTIFQLHSLYGNKWAAIASRLPGRTDNEIKNYWNSHLRKRIPIKTEREVEKPEPRLFSQWGSGVEHVFQKHSCSIPTPKLEPESVVTVQDRPYFMDISNSESCGHVIKEHKRFKEEAEEPMIASESPSSYEPDDASDITLDLLLDFPNDGEYLQYV